MNNTLEMPIIVIDDELYKARKKHPYFPEYPSEALSIIMEEVGELAVAINDRESDERMIEEAAHVAVTAYRFIEKMMEKHHEAE
jgi:NTP pyrophosphatase (non-canonical NTP hydrolase)